MTSREAVTAPPDVVRDPAAFPRSVGYRGQVGMVKVSAAALALAYSHLHIFEQPAGLTRRQTEEAGWHLFERVLTPAMAGGARFTPLPPGLAFTDSGGLRMHLANDCLAESVRRTTRALRMSWQEFAAEDRRSVDVTPAPAAWLHARDLAAVLWLEDAVRMFASGSEALQAARSAYDRHLGKPRQRRRPVEQAWLDERVQVTLDRLWYALLHARQGEGRGPLWLRGPLVDETRRPAWAYPTEGG
jgi:hypothetical protein